MIRAFRLGKLRRAGNLTIGETMKKLFLITLLSCAITTFALDDAHDQQQETSSFAVNVAPKEHAKLNLFCGIVGQPSKELRSMVHIIKQDLEFSGQFNVTLATVQDVHTKKEIENLFEKGFSLAIFINDTTKDNGVDWRIYDTTQATMIKGSKYVKRGTVTRGWAHNISDALWSVLAGQEGFFSTKIAYCKDIPRTRKKKLNIFMSQIMMAAMNKYW